VGHSESTFSKKSRLPCQDFRACRYLVLTDVAPARLSGTSTAMQTEWVSEEARIGLIRTAHDERGSATSHFLHAYAQIAPPFANLLTDSWDVSLDQVSLAHNSWVQSFLPAEKKKEIREKGARNGALFLSGGYGRSGPGCSCGCERRSTRKVVSHEAAPLLGLRVRRLTQIRPGGCRVFLGVTWYGRCG